MTTYRECPQFAALVYLWLHDRAGMLGEIQHHREDCEVCQENYTYVTQDMQRRLVAAHELSGQPSGRETAGAYVMAAAPEAVPAMQEMA